jgi:predicted nucleotidyltransferase component of viral defense system
MPIEDYLEGGMLNKARLQDVFIGIISGESGAVLHGGTTIWRCFGGKRFSKDIDIYFGKPKTLQKIVNKLKLYADLRIDFERERHGTHYYKLADSRTDISLQCKIRRVHKTGLSTYVNVDGSPVDVLTLLPEDLLMEKIAAYTDRRLERDLYDMKVLTASIYDKGKVKDALLAFLEGIKPPADRGALDALIYEGAHPTFEQLLEYLRRWVST